MVTGGKKAYKGGRGVSLKYIMALLREGFPNSQVWTPGHFSKIIGKAREVSRFFILRLF